MMQRLMPGTGVQRINPCRHRLDTFARQRQHQTSAIAFQPRPAIRMSQFLRQVVHVLRKSVAGAHALSTANEEAHMMHYFL
ncbi:hypothetical protein D3C87_1974510 [compost metagenome]